MTEEIQSISIDDLILDHENPRLPESLPRDEPTMLNHIAETTSIEDLMGAIGENDYFQGEPLVVVPISTNLNNESQKYVVVEGNRRLTALRLLQNPNICARPTARMKEIARDAQFRPKEVPVVIRQTRAEVLPYLGFRHITGVKQWEPLAKARYIMQLFDTTSLEASARDRYKEVANAIGSRRDHIKRNLDALAVYRTIKENDFFGIDELDEESIKFAVLSTALADDHIGSFVGVCKKNGDEFEPADPIVNPASLNIDSIRELTQWLYQLDSKGRTRVGESRNLRMLSAVVDSPRALAAFRAQHPLKLAYQLTSNVVQDFLEFLYQADGALTEAAGMVATVSFDSDAYDLAKRLSENIKLIGRTLKDKRSSDDDDF